ncbi:DUF6034 family protein [Christensenellaceae bacterium OttesenSCG-928-L17]|nr:DUF6034 family protein [Christensenellaceae bacterium OttesenSCG-928-L17]
MKSNKHILFALVVFLLLIACQPTPEPKAYTQLSEEEIPDRVQETFDLYDGIRLSIDAPVTLPEETLPSAEITRIEFSQEMIERVYATLCGDRPVYQFAEIKAELEACIMLNRTQEALLRAELGDDMIKRKDYFIRLMEDTLPTAPEEYTLGELADIRSYEDCIVKVDMGVKPIAFFQVSPIDADVRYVHFHNVGSEFVQNIPDAFPLVITQEQAVEQAEEILKKIGIIQNYSVAEVNIKAMYDSLYDGQLDDTVLPHAYEIIFLRTIADVEQNFSEQALMGTLTKYAPLFRPESITMTLNDTGLLLFEWIEPCEAVLEETPALIGLSSALERMKEQFSNTYNHYYFDELNEHYLNEKIDTGQVTIRIDRIVLGIVTLQGVNGSVRVVPIWEFFGNIECVVSGETMYYYPEYRELRDEKSRTNSLCSVDAVTGRVIDRTGM